MKIKELRKLIIGKTISYYDGFSGTHDYFIAGHLEYVGSSVRIQEEKGKGFGIFIPKKIILQLLENGTYVQKGEVEQCPFEIRWKII